jgi:signal transduction histidine kinase/HAMP domain-containing protein
MVDQLNAFAGEVTRVAREVGVEGRLGGQAQSTEVSGVWKDLTDNVNQLAANLTNQVRAIADVATAVTEGDLTRQVRVEASGEVAVLKDKLNEMIRNLRETTDQNIEQDWLKTNRERFTRMLQGQRDLATVSSMILSEVAPLVSAQHGVFYAMTTAADGIEPRLQFQAGYGYEEHKQLAVSFGLGEGLVGQCAKERKRILLSEVPGDYVRINSGLGVAPPLNIIVLPVLFEGTVRAVVELASFSRFSPTHQAFLDQITESIGLVLNTIEANTLTENLLEQSQSQAEELRSQQEELRSSNEDLGRQAALLAEQNIEASLKNQEVEQAKRLVEEKAGQLVVSSKYKSEFIANMSHELRTPLNSLLILAEQLEENPEHNMTATQVQYASVIRTSGQDLLTLLNNILDLAKVESGTVRANVCEVARGAVRHADARVRARRRAEERDVLGPRGAGLPAQRRNRSAATAPDPHEPAVQRVQVHRARRREPVDRPRRGGLARDERVAVRCPVGARAGRQRHGDRHRQERAPPDLRGLRPERRHELAVIRRHGPRAVDQPRARGPARRRDHRRQRTRRGQHLHRLPPARPCAGAARRARGRARAGPADRPGRRRRASRGPAGSEAPRPRRGGGLRRDEGARRR